jgi:hypothetical protein
MRNRPNAALPFSQQYRATGESQAAINSLQSHRSDAQVTIAGAVEQPIENRESLYQAFGRNPFRVDAERPEIEAQA